MILRDKKVVVSFVRFRAPLQQECVWWNAIIPDIVAPAENVME
jgi:hypothetical protein